MAITKHNIDLRKKKGKHRVSKYVVLAPGKLQT